MMINVFFVISAALSYTLGGYFMKHSDGFTQIAPTIAVLALFCLGASLQTFAMRQQEMTRMYIIVLGFEAICAFLFGTFLLGEVLTWQKLVGSVVVCIGVVLLRQ